MVLADRNVFSLFVLNLEAQLFHVNFEHITHMVVDMTHTQVTGLMDVSGAHVCVRVCVRVCLYIYMTFVFLFTYSSTSVMRFIPSPPQMLIAWKEILPLVDKMKGAPVVNASMSVSIGGVQGGVTNQH